MVLLPGLYERFVVESPATVEEIVAALRFHTQAYPFPSLTQPTREYYGWISYPSFEVRPTHGAFIRPTIRGRFERLPSGARIEVVTSIVWPEFALMLAGGLVPFGFVSLLLARDGGILRFAVIFGSLSVIVALSLWALTAAVFASQARRARQLLQFWIRYPERAVSPAGLHPSTVEFRNRRLRKNRIEVATVAVVVVSVALGWVFGPHNPSWQDAWSTAAVLFGAILFAGAELCAAIPVTGKFRSPQARMLLAVPGIFLLSILVVLVLVIMCAMWLSVLFFGSFQYTPLM